mgnify:CR=1 FL=1
MRVYHVIKNGNILILNLVVTRPWNCDSTSTETGIGKIRWLSGCPFLWFNLWCNYSVRDHSTVRAVFKDLRYRNNLAMFFKNSTKCRFSVKDAFFKEDNRDLNLFLLTVCGPHKQVLLYSVTTQREFVRCSSQFFLTRIWIFILHDTSEDLVQSWILFSFTFSLSVAVLLFRLPS